MKIEKISIKNKMHFRPISSHELYEKKICPMLKKMSEGMNDSDRLISSLRELKILTSALRIYTKETKLEDIQYTMLINLINCDKI